MTEHPEWAVLPSSALETLRTRLKTETSEVRLLEPRAYFDYALLRLVDSGEAGDHWPRKPGTLLAVYDDTACIAAIMAWMDCCTVDARKWFHSSIKGGWIGEKTPVFYTTPGSLGPPKTLWRTRPRRTRRRLT